MEKRDEKRDGNRGFKNEKRDGKMKTRSSGKLKNGEMNTYKMRIRK